MTSPTVDVTDVDAGHLQEIARLHVEAFPDSVLGRLGLEAVRRNYHWQLTGPHDRTALLATVDGEVVGFLFGGRFRGSTIGFVKREKWFLARRVVSHPAVLLRGVGWRRVGLAAKLLARRAPHTQVEEPTGVPRRSFGVLAIGVSPQAQGRGVGRTLMDRARARAIAEGYTAMHLTVHPENVGAVSFYRGLGWRPASADGESWSGRMTLDLPPSG